jgi:hypothetical protein
MLRVAHEQDLEADVVMVDHQAARMRSVSIASVSVVRNPSMPACGPPTVAGTPASTSTPSSASRTARFHSPIRPSHTTVELRVSG